MSSNIANRPHSTKSVAYDRDGNPIATNLSRHLALAELSDSDFDSWLAQRHAAEDRAAVDEHFAEVGRKCSRTRVEAALLGKAA